MALPDIPTLDISLAILIQDGAILFLRDPDRGTDYVLPFESIEPDESPEAACLRGALVGIRDAAHELATQLRVDLEADQISLAIQRKVGSIFIPRHSPFTFHFFLLSSNKKSILSDPESQPVISPYRFVWMPYAWVPLDQLPQRNLLCKEAVAICQQAALDVV
ncbi:MAG: hypothetical protein K8S99_16005 [Planctomycetes bacterium]|nr:hypothetical protein [Planctomycetota bacterium]